jgi:hypothetical protein
MEGIRLGVLTRRRQRAARCPKQNHFGAHFAIRLAVSLRAFGGWWDAGRSPGRPRQHMPSASAHPELGGEDGTWGAWDVASQELDRNTRVVASFFV